MPSVVESVWPACAVPVATGKTVFTGGSDCTIVGVGFEHATLIPFGPSRSPGSARSVAGRVESGEHVRQGGLAGDVHAANPH